MATVPQMTIAQGAGGMPTVYFINKYGKLASYAAQAKMETPPSDNGVNYVQQNIYEGDPSTKTSISTGSLNLGALSYWDYFNNSLQTRIYFVAPDMTLQELCLDPSSGNQWTRGSIAQLKDEDKQTVKVRGDSSICVDRQFDGEPGKDAKGQLKVYFALDDGSKTGRLSVAWITQNDQTGWQMRTIA